MTIGSDSVGNGAAAAPPQERFAGQLGYRGARRDVDPLPAAEGELNPPGLNPPGLSASGLSAGPLSQSSLGPSSAGPSGLGQAGLTQGGLGQGSSLGSGSMNQGSLGQGSLGQGGLGQGGLGPSPLGQRGLGPDGLGQPGSTAANGAPTNPSLADLDSLTEPTFPTGWLDGTGMVPGSLADHPLLRGLLLELPPKGTAPTAEWLDRWFEAARSILELLYEQGAAHR